MIEKMEISEENLPADEETKRFQEMLKMYKIDRIVIKRKDIVIELD